MKNPRTWKRWQEIPLGVMVEDCDGDRWVFGQGTFSIQWHIPVTLADGSTHRRDWERFVHGVDTFAPDNIDGPFREIMVQL